MHCLQGLIFWHQEFVALGIMVVSRELFGLVGLLLEVFLFLMKFPGPIKKRVIQQIRMHNTLDALELERAGGVQGLGCQLGLAEDIRAFVGRIWDGVKMISIIRLFHI